MKTIIFLMLILTLSASSQVQIGEDFEGLTGGSELGTSVSLALNGTLIAIGEPGFIDDTNSNTGLVQVFQWTNDSWVQLGNDVLGESGQGSGYSVSLSPDGTFLAVGARTGTTPVYRLINNEWQQFGRPIESEAWSISVSEDGKVAIGNPSNSGNNSLGSVIVYQNNNNFWVPVGEELLGEEVDDWFGHSIDLTSDGNFLAVGAPYNNSIGEWSGHVRIFQFQNNSWNQIGQDIDGKAEREGQGFSVSLSQNGDMVAIGAVLNDIVKTGKVRVYENVNGQWDQIGNDITSEDDDDLLGYSTSISSDGSKLVAGSPFNDDAGNNFGKVSVYNILADGLELIQSINGKSEGESKGFSVDMSFDGSTLAAGAPYNSENGLRLGKLRVYDVSNVLTIEQFANLKGSLYPNPTKEILNVELVNGNSLKNVDIFNNLGQLVLSSNESKIDTSSLNAGIYHVTIESSKGIIFSKLVINK